MDRAPGSSTDCSVRGCGLPPTVRMIAMTPRRRIQSRASWRSRSSSRALVAFVRRVDAPRPMPRRHHATPVMGPNLLTAAQLARWYNQHSGGAPRSPTFRTSATTSQALARDLHRRGPARRRARRHRVRAVDARDRLVHVPGSADPARLQQLRGHLRVRQPPRRARSARHETPPSRCFGHAAARRARADPAAAQLRRPDIGKAPGRLVHLRPVDRIGMAPIWEYFGGTCVRQGDLGVGATDYGMRIIQLYSRRARRATARAGVPAVLADRGGHDRRAPATGSSTTRRRSCTRSAHASVLRRRAATAPQQAAHRRRVAPRPATVYWLLGARRRHLLLRRRELLRLDRRACA